MIDEVVIAVSVLDDPVDDALELGDVIVWRFLSVVLGIWERANVLDMADIYVLRTAEAWP